MAHNYYKQKLVSLIASFHVAGEIAYKWWHSHITQNKYRLYQHTINITENTSKECRWKASSCRSYLGLPGFGINRATVYRRISRTLSTCPGTLENLNLHRFFVGILNGFMQCPSLFYKSRDAARAKSARIVHLVAVFAKPFLRRLRTDVSLRMGWFEA